MSVHNKLLLVEGIYDFHLLKQILTKYNLPCEQYNKNKNIKTISIKGMDSISNAPGQLEIFLDKVDVNQLGIVADADNSFSNRLHSIQNHLSKKGELQPIQEGINGFLGVLIRPKLPPIKVGIWVMPDNENPGMLEHFASNLIPENDSLWLHTQNIVRDLPEKRFHTPPQYPVNHTRKAELYTWLAWQENPGRPLGIALQFNYLQYGTSQAQRFVDWVQRLFSPEN